LGAQPNQILRSVVADGVGLAGAGLVCGLAITLGAGRIMRTLVFAVSVFDPLTIAMAIGVLIPVALDACHVPAWRASRIDPMLTLTVA
jgi:ABC-type antimicrobial peptide transport system permease subunit